MEEITKDNIITKLKEADKKNKKIKVYHTDKNVPNFSNYTVINFLIFCSQSNYFI